MGKFRSVDYEKEPEEVEDVEVPEDTECAICKKGFAKCRC